MKGDKVEESNLKWGEGTVRYQEMQVVKESLGDTSKPKHVAASRGPEEIMVNEWTLEFVDWAQDVD